MESKWGCGHCLYWPSIGGKSGHLLGPNFVTPSVAWREASSVNDSILDKPAQHHSLGVDSSPSFDLPNCCLVPARIGISL